MGIGSLLPLLAPVSKRTHISEFRGKRIAIDGFVWLHKAAFSCAMLLVANPATPAILPYLEKRLASIIKNGLIPIVIFDGQSLPMKEKTCDKRRQTRQENLETAMRLKDMGKSSEAFSYFQRAIEINQDTVQTWIKSLKASGVEFIVSPYEADAQMAYLARTGYVDIVLTEDSDLIPYQTPTTLYKLDDEQCVVAINYADVLNHLQLTSDEFLTFCILCGCDYCDKIFKMGQKTALTMVQRLKDITSIMQEVRTNPKFGIPEDFEAQFSRSVITFHHHIVYDPRTRVMKTLEPMATTPPEFLGQFITGTTLSDYVSGNLNVFSLKPIETGHSSPYFEKSVSQPVKSPIRSSSSPYFKTYTKKISNSQSATFDSPDN